MRKDLNQSVITHAGLYASNVKGFKTRSPQVKMIGSIVRTLSKINDEINQTPACVIEGPPGTGKTFGLMAGAIPTALLLGKKLIISTANVGLQEQIVDRDLPTFVDAADCKASFAIAKGRRRYLCPRKIDRLNNKSENRILTTEFKSGRWKGDMDTAPTAIDANSYQNLTADSKECIGTVCEYVTEGLCPFYLAKRKAELSDIVVCNHDLLLTCAFNKASSILPDLEDSIILIDEAHHIPKKAQSRVVSRASTQKTKEMANRLSEVFGNQSLIGKIANQILTLVNDLENETLRFRFNEKGAMDGVRVCRLRSNNAPEFLTAIAREIATSLHNVLDHLIPSADKLAKEFARNQDNSHTESAMLELRSLEENAIYLRSAWGRIDMKSTSENPLARWVERRQNNDLIKDISICITELMPGRVLMERLWSRAAGVVLASGTLKTLGTFDRFAETSGLNLIEDVEWLSLESPFNFEENARLRVPMIEKTPRDEGFSREIAQWLNRNIDLSIGGLVLFTSYSRMSAVLKQIDSKIREHILVQGDLSKAEMIETHKTRIEAGQGSWLFGVDSLAEGLDLPGNLLQHVIITSLPFAVPTTPEQKALDEYLKSKGRNTFQEVFIPDCSEKLVQMVGRLIRTVEDKGEVTILDRRIVTKKYGRLLLDDLPPMKRIIEGSTDTSCNIYSNNKLGEIKHPPRHGVDLRFQQIQPA